ncbi:hypothetical protein CROQUDRAFT_35749 [Cronartium quercuum f. sp. fusiforme G11]|uniref:Uncharacterized protein n=1 Tax=Cronartium quercuum f. sp. fusiforme G11 TaxID=708437 RepID=A0A9P6NXR7_9BASI|nr:hypothetical protein CROQUDRAFT_35749 [Cronartium quercuum f. sp. fusiforme G11]
MLKSRKIEKRSLVSSSFEKTGRPKVIARQTSQTTSHIRTSNAVTNATNNKTAGILPSSSPYSIHNDSAVVTNTTPLNTTILKPASALYTEPLPSLGNSEKEVLVPVSNSTRISNLTSSENQIEQNKGDKVGWIGGISVCFVALVIAIGLCICHKRRKNKQKSKEHSAFWDDESDGINGHSAKDDDTLRHSPQNMVLCHDKVSKTNKTEIQVSEFEDDPPKPKKLAWLTLKAFSRHPPRELQVFHIDEKPLNQQVDTIQMERKNREKVRNSVPMPLPIHVHDSTYPNQHQQFRNSNGLNRDNFGPTSFDEPQSVVSYPLRSNGHLDLNSPSLDLGKDGYGVKAKEEYGHYTLLSKAMQRQQAQKKSY